MRTMPWMIVAMSLALRAVTGQELADGLYLQGAPNAPVRRAQDGKDVHVGAAVDRATRSAAIVAHDNANTRFSLTLDFPYDAALQDGPAHVLVVGGVALRQCGAGSTRDVSSALPFELEGRDLADRVAARYGVTPRLRRHPLHALRVEFVPTRARYERGADVTVALQLTNVGTTPVAFMKGGRNRAARDNQYAFAAFLAGAPVLDIGSSNHFGGLSVRVVLEPGKTFRDEVDLRKWYAFDAAGSYQLVGTYALDLVDPASADWHTIWHDVVAAELTLRIDDAPSGK